MLKSAPLQVSVDPTTLWRTIVAPPLANDGAANAATTATTATTSRHSRPVFLMLPPSFRAGYERLNDARCFMMWLSFRVLALYGDGRRDPFKGNLCPAVCRADDLLGDC